MNKKEETSDVPASAILDRRYFLKASTAAVALAVTGTILSDAVKVSAEEVAPIQKDSTNPEKQYKAGWMAF
jgi:hypothetical protein